MRPYKGYELFITEPDEQDEMFCRVCGSRCNVERSVIGPTSFMEAAGHRGHWHDKFICPHFEQDWHKQARALVIQIERTPSKRIAGLMSLDLEDILKEHPERSE